MKGFQATKVIKRCKQTNLAPPEKVFPLLCPVREADWLQHWKYDLIYSESGFAEQGCIFRTPFEGSKHSTWIVTHYDPLKFSITFAKFTPGTEINLIRIRLEDNKDSTTAAYIEYEFTALNEERKRYLKSEIHDYFDNMMAYWEKAINHYLTTGKMYIE